MKTPHKCRVPGLNIGCTSFIIPDYYVPAIRECVHYADDIALLLLEAGEHGEGLITPAEIRELAGIAAAKADVTGAAVDGAARQVIADAGYGPYFGHSFGHSVGVEIHENPNATPSNSKPLPAGAVISAEPGIYLPGKLGVRIEDVIVITEQGCQDITLAPKELLIL